MAQVLLLALISCLVSSRLVLSCFVLSCLFGFSAAVFGLSAATTKIQLWRSFYSNGRNIRCARVRKGRLMLAKPIRFHVVGF